MPDQTTLAAYAKLATGYSAGQKPLKNTDQETDYHRFTAALPPRAHILDLGCGPGHWSARFIQDGYQVTAIDPCIEMARHAQNTYQIPVIISSVETFHPSISFDAI